MIAFLFSVTYFSEIRQKLKEEVEKLKTEYTGFVPGLAIVQVGDRSDVYITQKMKASIEVGIDAQHIKLPRSSTQAEIIQTVQRLNADVTIHGIIVQLPLETDVPVDTRLVTTAWR